MAYVKKTTNPNYGRPKTNRNVRLELRLSESENQILVECSSIMGVRKTDVIVYALSQLHKQLHSPSSTAND